MTSSLEALSSSLALSKSSLELRRSSRAVRSSSSNWRTKGDSGAGGALVGGEEAVLAYVDVDALERLAEIAPRVRTGPKRLAHGNGLRAIDQRNRLPFAADG